MRRIFRVQVEIFYRLMRFFGIVHTNTRVRA